MHVAIQGQAGSFHDQAAHQWYGASAEIVPCTTFSEVFAAYNEGSADAIVAAVENTLFGSINEVYRYIEECSAPIVGEIKLPVEQMLIGLPNAKISDITEVYSHPVALSPLAPSNLSSKTAPGTAPLSPARLPPNYIICQYYSVPSTTIPIISPAFW